MARSTSIYLGEKLDTQIKQKAQKYGISQGEYMRACLAYCTYFLDDFDKAKAEKMVLFIKTNCDESCKDFIERLLDEEEEKKREQKQQKEPIEEISPKVPFIDNEREPVEPKESVQNPVTASTVDIIDSLSDDNLSDIRINLINPTSEFKLNIENVEDAEIRSFIDRVEDEFSSAPKQGKKRKKITYSGTAI